VANSLHGLSRCALTEMASHAVQLLTDANNLQKIDPGAVGVRQLLMPAAQLLKDLMLDVEESYWDG